MTDLQHDVTVQYIHWLICRTLNLLRKENWWEPKSPQVVRNEVTIQHKTDREIQATRQDMIVKNHVENICLLIDVAASADKNTSLKTFKKVQEAKDRNQSNVACRADHYPVVIEVLRMNQMKETNMRDKFWVTLCES